jgi:hypothetical protein
MVYPPTVLIPDGDESNEFEANGHDVIRIQNRFSS